MTYPSESTLPEPPPTPPLQRWLPDSALLTMDVLRAVGIDVVDQMPVAPTMRYPLVHVRRIPGSGAVHARFLDLATMEILAFAQDRSEALDLAEGCRTALYAAWEAQTIYPNGSITSYEEISGVGPLPSTGNQPDREVVAHATYRLAMSPPLHP